MIVALAALLRVLFLGVKPPHFDEGINGWFVDQMTKNGFYRYDPTNYHGPLHFYILFLSQTLFGRNVWALRHAGRAGEHFVHLAPVQIPAVRRSHRRPAGGARDGALAGLRLLWPLRDPRGLAASVLDDVHPRRARGSGVPARPHICGASGWDCSE
jgi:hypothetical protein